MCVINPIVTLSAWSVFTVMKTTEEFLGKVLSVRVPIDTE